MIALKKANKLWKMRKLSPYEKLDKLISLRVSFILFCLSSSIDYKMDLAPILIRNGINNAKAIGINES
jgi:hypothetical protein